MLKRFGPSLWKSKEGVGGGGVLKKMLLIHLPVGKNGQTPNNKKITQALDHTHTHTLALAYTVPEASFQLLPLLRSHLGEMYNVWVERHFQQDFFLFFFFTSACPSCKTAVNVSHMIKNDIKQNIDCFLGEHFHPVKHFHHSTLSRKACLKREIWNNCWTSKMCMIENSKDCPFGQNKIMQHEGRHQALHQLKRMKEVQISKEKLWSHHHWKMFNSL